jgi:hypothetical protein
VERAGDHWRRTKHEQYDAILVVTKLVEDAPLGGLPPDLSTNMDALDAITDAAALSRALTKETEA